MAAKLGIVPVELLLDAQVVDRLAREMREAAPRRTAGFLLGETSGVVVLARAISPGIEQDSNDGAPALSGSDYRRAIGKARSLGLKVIGTYRTHPDGDASITLTDVAEFKRSRLASLIVTARKSGAQPRLDAYAPPAGGAITVAVGRK